MIQKLTRSTEAVLEHFFRHPTREIHIRGLARETDIPYSSVRHALDELGEEGLLDRREESKMTFFSADRENATFRQQKQLHNLQLLSDSGLVDALEEQFRPDALVLFGSYLQGTDREDSDVDIAVVNGRDTDVDLQPYEDVLERHVQPVQIEDARGEETEFRNTLANGFVLRGFLTVV